MKKSKMLKLNRQHLTGFMVPFSNLKSVPFSKEPVLVDSSEIKEVVDLDSTIITSDYVTKGDQVYTQDKVLVGNDVTTRNDTYHQTIDKKEIKTKYMGIYDSQVDAHKDAQTLEDKQQYIKGDMDNHNGDYTYRVVVQEIDVTNNDITVETDSSINATRQVLGSLKQGSKITGVKEGIKESSISQHVSGVVDTLDSANKIISTISGNSDNENVVEQITPVRNSDKDNITSTTEVVNSKKKADDLVNKSSCDDKEEVVVTSETFMEDKDVTLSPRKVKTKEEAKQYINQMISEGYNVVSRSLKPLFISRKINEVYDTELDAKKRKNELESLYPGHEINIKPERDITKDSTSSEIDEREFKTKEEANEVFSDLSSDKVKYEVFSGNRLEMLTMANEYYKSPDEAMIRVEEVRQKSVPGIPIHYSITKFDKSYYALSMAYYAYVTFYQVEVIKTSFGYKYRVIGEIPKVDSYSVEVTAKKQVPRYRITKTINTKGYDYKYDVKYNKKVYTSTYTVSSVTPMYQLLVKGKGTYEVTKEFTKSSKSVTPIYKFDTKVNSVVMSNDKKELINGRVKELERTA